MVDAAVGSAAAKKGRSHRGGQQLAADRPQTNWALPTTRMRSKRFWAGANERSCLSQLKELGLNVALTKEDSAEAASKALLPPGFVPSESCHGSGIEGP